MPPEHHGAATIVAQAMERLGVHEPEELAAPATDRILTVLVTLCVTEPRRADRWRKLRRMGRGITRYFTSMGDVH